MIRNKKKSLVLVFVAMTMTTVSCTTPSVKAGAHIEEKRTIKSLPAKIQGMHKKMPATNLQGSNDQQSKKLTIEQIIKVQTPVGHEHGSDFTENDLAYNQWLNADSHRVKEVKRYTNYLARYVGRSHVPPGHQLLTTARSWEKCGFEQFQVPPRELWQNMVKTLTLFKELKRQGVVPETAEIRSAYRSPALNACAGGSAGSKHMTNGAIDIWIPEFEEQPWNNYAMKDRLCTFWSNEGRSYDFGLGMYATGAIHLDTQGYRIWGTQFTSYDSSCRDIRR